MSEASSGRAADGKPGGHEGVIWRCSSSTCGQKMQNAPGSIRYCPFCGAPQEGFSRAPDDVSGPRPMSPQSTAQEEHPQYGKEPDITTVPNASSSKNGEVNPPVDDEASKRSEEETPSPNKYPKMDGARDRNDSPEPGTKTVVSSPQLPLAASAATPSSPSTELFLPSIPLPPPPGPSHLPPHGPPLPLGDPPPSQAGPPLPPGDSPLSQTGPTLPLGGSPPSHPPDGSTLSPDGCPPSQIGPHPPLSKDQPPLKPKPSNLTGPRPLLPSAGAPIPTTDHPLSEDGSPQDYTEANNPHLPNDNPATNSKPAQPSPTSDNKLEQGSDMARESPPPGKRGEVQPNGNPSDGTPPIEDKGVQNGAKGVGAGERNGSPLSQPNIQSSSQLGQHPLRNDLSGATEAAAHTAASTDKKGRNGIVESEAGQCQPGATDGPAANTRLQTMGQAYKKKDFDEQAGLYEGNQTSKNMNSAGRTDSANSPQTSIMQRDVTTCDIPGFNPPPEKCLAVTFYVLVPTEMWEWSEGSRIHLLFGHSEMGNWECPVGDFGSPNRMVDGEHYEMQCTLDINVDVMKRSSNIPYKYIIISPKRKNRDIYEFLHNPPGSGIMNRCLSISKSLLQAPGIYDIFDNIIYPSTESHRKFTFKRTFPFISRSGGDDQLVIHHHDTMQVICLNAYLTKMDILLSDCGLSPEMNIGNAVHQIMEIVRQLRLQFIMIDTESSKQTWIAKEIPEEFVKWLRNIAEKIQWIPTVPPVNNGRRIAVVIVIAMCFHKLAEKRLAKPPDGDIAALLLSMLELKPDTATNSCVDFDFVKSLLVDSSSAMTAAVSALRFFGAKLALYKNITNPMWLYALPLIHFLQGKNSPFSMPQLDPEKIVWNDTFLPLDAIEKSLPQKFCNFVETHFKLMKPLFEADPLLLPIFVHVCPKTELHLLIRELPPHISLSWLSKLIHECDVWPDKVKEFRFHLECVTAVVKVHKDEDSPRPHLFKATLSGSLMYMHFLRGRIHSISKDTLTGRENICLLRVTIELISNAAAQYLSCCESHSDEDATYISECSGKLASYLKDLVVDSHVVGGSLFGNTKLARSDTEFHLWESLLSVNCHDDFLESWHGIVHKLVKSRVDNLVPYKLKIDLLMKLKVKEETHPVLADIFIGAAMSSLERMMDEGIREAAATVDLLMLNVSNKHQVGELMGSLIRKQYPHVTKDVTFKELLQWDMWPSFIELYTSEALMIRDSKHSPVSCLPEDCVKICAGAHELFTALCNRIRRGEVTIEELHSINKRQEHVMNMCTAISKHTKDSEGELNFTSLKVSLDQRMAEFKALMCYLEQLGVFCRFIGVPITGLEKLKDMLNLDVNSMKICDLCTSDDKGDFIFPYLSAALPLNPMLNQFFLLKERHPNSVFIMIWSDSVNTALSQGSELEISDVASELWFQTFQVCQVLLESLKNRTIQLFEVDKYFRQFSQDCKSLTENITVFYHGMCACMNGSEPKYPEWIQSLVINMQQYWSLSRCSEAATTLLHIKDILHLNGDFTVVKQLAEKVSISMHDQPLKAIDGSLVETKMFLDEFVGDYRKLHCLKVFCKCTDIVKWLKEETKDVSDLQNFVSVALTTAAGGEGDFTNDQLSNLRTVVGGFGSLIYDLKSHMGFLEFRDCCKSLWDSLDHTNNYTLDLSTLLEGCNKELDWFKGVKDTQGSVERSTFGQMSAIMEYGRYHIASSTFQTIYKMISVTLEGQDKRLHKKYYTLDELRDLESKLVLITGSQAENRKTVDLFIDTLHCVCRIAEALIALQQAGEVDYIVWTITIPCAKNTLSDLCHVAENMEQRLCSWNEEVVQARKGFYELNYFTTIQLLMLRKDMVQVKAPDTPCLISPSALTLLQSVSADVNMDGVCNVVHRLCGQHFDFEEVLGSTQQYADSSTYSAEQSMSATILASIDEHTSAISVAMPIVYGCDETTLSVEQMEIITSLTEQFNFHEKLILKAIQECGDDYHECLNWCSENDGLLSFSDDVDESESEGELSSDAESMGIPTTTEPSDNAINDSISPKVKVIAKILIDESHFEVQKLQEAGYTLEESISAIQRYESASTAVDYLMSAETEESEEFFQSSRVFSRSSSGEQVESSREIVIQKDVEAASKYLSLNELGLILHGISEQFPPAGPQSPRLFSSYMKSGQPNLIVSPPENVLKTVLALYMEDESSPLPSYDEVLICNQLTTEEEVTLLWRRAIGDPGFNRIFSLVHAERLSYHVCNKTLRSLQDISQGKHGYRVVIVCSNHDEDKSHIVSKLEIYRKQFVIPNDDGYRDYLKHHFTVSMDGVEHPTHQQGVLINASAVDPDNSCVRVVSSHRSGMGKSLYIKRRAELLNDLNPSSKRCVTIPIHGPRVTPDSVMAFLKDHIANSTGKIFHIDVSTSVLHLMDTILFSLLVLRGLRDSLGYVWRCHTSQLYAVEITKSGTKYELQRCCMALLNLLPTVECIAPIQALECMAGGSEGTTKILMDNKEFESDCYQRVYQYLRRHAANLNLDTFSYPGTVEASPTECLNVLQKHCGVRDPSWSEIYHFVTFLDIQLQSCEQSVFCNEEFVGDVMSGLKSFVVNFMMAMSKDFATSSLHGEVVRENIEETGEVDDQTVQYAIHQRKQWEQIAHPYIFFNWDRFSITFVGFKVSPDRRILDPDGRTIEVARMSKQLLAGLKHNKVNFAEDYRQWNKLKMIEKIRTVLGLDLVSDPDPTYVLTPDNLVKILAIHMRFRCNIPVVIMGETGCGKTRLIRFMCNLMAQGSGQQNMLILKVHGGITEQDIISFVKKGIVIADKNRKHSLDTVLFFDEANTTDAIGLIKEIMCDRRLQGCPLTTDIKFIAACNPYRKHSQRMISKLESAGLGFYVRMNETLDKLGSIPLRQLVYRVLDLPPSMRPLVYDFGQLNLQTEKDYSKQIVKDYVSKPNLLLSHTNAECIANVLAFAQQYMRESKDECSFVSLRDVKRAMIVFEYFYGKMSEFGPWMDKKSDREYKDLQTPDPVTRSLVLAVGVCYHAKLQDRQEFECNVAAQFSLPLRLPGGATQFRNEIRYCQEVLLDNMKIGENIARNAALRENIFMMAVCIELRIPLFLVGKPGSSKSLAKSIIADSMRGKVSPSPLLKNFKEVHMLSFQCSQLSTPEGVIDVFTTAKRFQKDKDTSKYVSVVVLDEVGLAEDSPNLPLKALHPLLEDGTERCDDNQIVDREKRVAFIGISNWALDPAKMNRGVMVTRSDPDEEELELSARGICSFEEDDQVNEILKPYFKQLASAYKEVCRIQTKDFFGLRDFYSLIKMLYSMCKQSGISLTAPQLKHAIQRNFGGWEDDDLNPLEIFSAKVHPTEPPDLSSLSLETRQTISPDCSKLGLIKSSLKTKETTWHGENRYLLFLTENYAALDILRHYLKDILSSSSSEVPSAEDTEPFVLFGSSFPRDKEYTQVCRNINRIKICMETGRTVILLNLENLYESLYDLLNQYYLHSCGQRYVDLGLQTLRVKCRVHNNFKLILIAEKTTVYEKFPTPLINRLEKHFVLTSSVLQDWQQHILQSLNEWICNFSEITQFRDTKFSKEDAFIGYQKDTPSAVIFQATKQIEKLCEKQNHPSTVQRWTGVLRSGLMGFTLDDVTEGITPASDQYLEMVLSLSKYLMLQTAPEDALIRLQGTRLADTFNQQFQLYKFHFSTVTEFLKYHLSTSSDGHMFQVTTHSHLIPEDKMVELECSLNLKISSCVLQEFDTELDFTHRISPSFKERGFMDRLLIIQCDSGHMAGDLIACARYRVLEERRESMQRNQLYSDETGSAQPQTHVLFIIYLPKREIGSSFVGFQGDPWVCTHIDNLLPLEDAIGTPQLQDVIGHSISKLFYQPEDAPRQDSDYGIESYTQDGNMDHNAAEVPVLDPERLHSVPKRQIHFCIRLHGCIHAAVSRVEDNESHSLPKSNAKRRIDILLRLIPKEPSGVIDLTTFFGIIVYHIHRLLEEREEIYKLGADWILKEALNTKKLQSSGTFQSVLARKLDEEMIHPLREIIVFIDRYYNLDLLCQVFSDRSKEYLAHLWLAIFGLPTILPFKFKDLITGQKVPGVGGRLSGPDFKCQFPFSWVVKQTFDEVWINAKTVAGHSKLNRWIQLCEEVQKTYIGKVLMDVDECDSHSLYTCYLHDFVRIVHNCCHKKTEHSDMEHKLVCRSLHSVVLCEEFSTMDGHKSLLQLIASLHVIYHMFESEVMWFGQLASCMPQILQKLDQTQYADSNEMILHLCAVECALSSGTLKPPIEKDEKVFWNNWLILFRQSRTTVESILNISPHHPRAIEARKKWQLARVLQSFLEHLLLKHEYVEVPHVRRLHLSLIKDPDFLKASAIEKVKRHLNSMITTLKRKQREKMELKNSCQAYFMEVISSLCFGGVGVPEPQLVKLLLDTVFIDSVDEQISTKDLTPYKGEQDSVPVIRSFILQLLLEHSSEQVKEHLNYYFVRSSRALSNKAVDSNVCLLIVKCFEDNLYREHATKPLTERMTLACSILESGGDSLVGHAMTPQEITVDYLEGIAGVRFALVLAADILNSRISKARSREHSFTAQADHLLKLTERVCTDASINHIDITGTTDTIGPNVYLLKLLVRQFGSTQMMEVSKVCGWVLPPQLRTEHTEVKMHDHFVIYEQVYSDLRQVLNDAAYGKQFQQLKEATEVLTLQDVPLLILALYEKATLSRASVLPSKQLLPEVLEVFEEVIKESKLLSNELKLMARALIANQQGGPLGQMQITPAQSVHCRRLGSVVIHAATVFLYRKRMEIILPFINMINSPNVLANAYLPTMPQDHLAEVRNAVLQSTNGAFYECPRGHPYYVGECGNPVEEIRCAVCGSSIGGIGSRLRSDNRSAHVNDTTQRGYALGNPEDRSEVPAPERMLSSASCCIVRALMHCALVWASCNNESAVEGLYRLVKKRPHELAEFFWRHLERDIELLGSAINKNAEESALVLHLVLKNILTCNRVSSGDTLLTVNDLGSQDARETWEDIFNKTYIQPVLEKVDKSIGDAMGVILSDDHQEHDSLFYLLYERVSVSEDSLAPHLWTYRARITLEHLSQTLQQQSSRTKYPILIEFLKEEPSLRATQYLPDIIKLQQRLYDCFHRRLDRKDATRLIIRDFLQQRTNEHARIEYKLLIDSFKCAWALTRDKLHDYGRLHVDEEYISQDINDTTPLEYLIPTTTGPGACSMALTDFLTLTHNNFIQKCRAITNKGTASNFMWDECKVPITHLHRCHLLDYEHQLLSIILSHCHYSLTLGKGEDVNYDLAALEKHILNRFIHGKPTILADIPQVVYRRDVYNAATFAAIRTKVKPQLRLSTQAQREIVAELRSMEKLRNNLDVVEIVIGFLSSGGGRADKALEEYIRILKMSSKSFSKKAKEHCTLGHVLSLWELLSVHLAKRLALKDQEPFDTLPAEYHDDITPEQRQSLDCNLGSFELDQLLGVLYEFLEVYVQHSPLANKEWMLMETLVPFLVEHEIPPIAHFEAEFPPDITLSQAAAAWKYIVVYQDRVQGREARPTS